MADPVFEGVGVALATLFDAQGDVDAVATAEHARLVVERGVRAVVVAGSTGEAAALSAEERVALVRAVRGAVDVPVLAGTGAPSTRQAVRYTADAVDAGVDGVLVLSPPRTNEPRPYYDAVAAAAGHLPVLAYHFPTVSPPGLSVELLSELPITGVKDSSGDPDRLLELLDTFGGDVYIGAATLLVQAGAIGTTGAILALANLEPELCIDAFAGDAEAQRALGGAHRVVSRDFPHGLKRAMASRHGTSPVTRLG